LLITEPQSINVLKRFIIKICRKNFIIG